MLNFVRALKLGLHSLLCKKAKLGKGKNNRGKKCLGFMPVLELFHPKVKFSLFFELSQSPSMLQ